MLGQIGRDDVKRQAIERAGDRTTGGRDQHGPEKSWSDASGGSGGILVVDKPRGLTSRAVVDRVAAAGRPGQGRSCRHARPAGLRRPGRLRRAGDPAGRGDPRLAQVVPDRGPAGGAERHARRGRADRVPGEIRASPSPDEVAAAVAPLVGEVDQMPPEYSASEDRGPACLRPGAGRAGGRAGPAPGPDRPDRRAFATNGRTWSWRSIAAAGPISARSPATSARSSAAAGWSRSWSGPGSGRSRSKVPPDLDGLSAESLPGLFRPAVEARRRTCPGWCSTPDQVAADRRRTSALRRSEMLASLPPRPDRPGRSRRPARRPGRARSRRRLDPAAQGLCESVSYGTCTAECAAGRDPPPRTSDDGPCRI